MDKIVAGCANEKGGPGFDSSFIQMFLSRVLAGRIEPEKIPMSDLALPKK